MKYYKLKKDLPTYYKRHYDKFEDTFYMECDDMLKEKE